ncbi:hypothetical protein NSK_007857 [Nannochloropsis salina CCMP1776]|uniref:Photosystem II reaction center M protein n=2 Tax=cellular organisms TaxID=131567 RepID=A0A4D9CNG8_9STRA|nr:hypothetical protein NSK_007857 [Nannochloropsis salina CCMP1776]|eukprot:TFJ80680.1 hypothetical protein NSK_007857 [Nannochloropsis salina CCMP1776]
MSRTSMLFVTAIAALLALSAQAFVPTSKLVQPAAVAAGRKAATSMKLDVPAVVAGLAPAALAAPAFAADQIMTALPSTTVSLEVTFAAYLAVLLGTFVPVAFLIILYIQSESRKAGEAAGRGE